jgi:epsilon-lactone hydrolase
MVSLEAKRIRTSLFPCRTVPELTVSEWRAQELHDSSNDTLPEGVRVITSAIAGLHSEWIENTCTQTKRTLLYFHGGGYVLGASVTRRNVASRLAIAAAARAVVPQYRLAPEHPFPAAVYDAIAVYDALLEQGVRPSSLAVMGDSAGGGLCAALLLSLRDSGRPLPAAGVLISPWTDLTLSGESYRTRADSDPIDRVPLLRRMAATYVANGDPTNPLASPLFGNLRGLPPMLIQVGDHEVLLDDSVRFAGKARASGVSIELEVWPQMWHVWHTAAPALPEANEAITQIGAYVRQRTSASE